MIISTRATLVAGAAALASLLCLRAAGAQSAPTKSVVTQSYETVKVADGVYAFVSPEAYGSWVSGNSTVVIGDSGVLVVDSGHFPDLTRRMIADIRKITDRPVRFLVNTHWHPDHWLGNGEYRRAFPNLTIIAAPVARAEIAARGPEFIRQHQDSAGTVKQYRELIAKNESLWRPNAPLNADERRGLELSIVDGQAAAAGWRLARLEVPTLTFDQRLTVSLGNRDAQVVFLGRGNTAGDAVVYVPDVKVVATGDLVVYPIPYAYGSFIGEWISTMRKLMALGATTFVPGHGPVERDTSYVALVTDVLLALQSQVSDAVKRGLSLDDARKVVHLESFERRFEGDNPLRRELFYIHFIVPGLPRAYAEAKYEAGK